MTDELAPREDLTADQVRTIMPGMEEVVEAGDTLVITDRDGKEIAVQGRESRPVMEALVALDNYVVARSGGVEGVVLDSLWNTLLVAYQSLPARVRRELPSAIDLATRITHGH